MSDSPGQFEISDKFGTSDSYSGTVGTTYTAVPTVAGNNIQEFTVICDPVQTYSNILFLSLDGGTTTIATMYPGGFYSGIIKGSKTQIHLKGNVASVSYQALMNRETL